MPQFRTLYTFTFPKECELEKKEESVNAAGETVTVTKKVKDKKDFEFCLQKPTRSLLDDAELFYNVTVSKGIQAGLMSAALLAKRFNNDGGVLSEKDKDEWGNKFVERVKKELTLQKLTIKENRTEEEEAQYEEALKDVATLTREMQEFEVRQQSLFDITAEARARTRTIMWWLFFLLYGKNEKGEWVPFFSGANLEEKQWAYDDLDDDELYPEKSGRDFNTAVISHAVQAIMFWYYGKARKQEDFPKAFAEHLSEKSVFNPREEKDKTETAKETEKEPTS